jgi:anaerobic dimethyl sulfoxide reductase subunit A
MTATAKWADILLPMSHFLERNDLCLAEGVPYYGLMQKAVEPQYETKSHLEIADELAKRMGISDFNDKTEEQWLRQMINGTGVTSYEELQEKGAVRPEETEDFVAFQKQIEDPEHNPFLTPSGKIEIYSQRLADMNSPLLPPIPKYVETWESINDPLAKKYPLQVITSHLRRRAHTQFETIPWLRELQTQEILMHPKDAESRGIKNGDMVRVFNDRGEMTIPVKVTENIMPGVIDVPQGAWYDPDSKGVDKGGCANVLSNDSVSPGGAVPYNTGLAQVEKAKS